MTKDNAQKETARIFASLYSGVKRLNELGISRAALVTIDIEKYVRIVVHGDAQLVKGIASSDIKDHITLTETHSRCVTLPMIDVTPILQSVDATDRKRGLTEVLEVEMRPRKMFFDKRTPPAFWDTTIPYKSPYSDGMDAHIDKIVRDYQKYREDRWDTIVSGGETSKYDRTASITAGVIGARRDLYDKLIDGSLQWKQEELIIQREFPTLYRSLRPLICGNTFPKSVLGTLDYIRSESDYLLVTAPHNESYYGPLIESRLESFPLWPLQRGLTAYRKDSNKEQQLDCAEKVVGENKKLSPGIMLIMCTHRRPYGFRVLKTPESIRDVFQIVLSRLGSNMPQTIIYDNCCHLAAYALAREPARFANVRFLIDRFHHDNHVSCSLSLRLRSYDSDPSMASLNSQSCEQTNALLRKLGNSLPYMALPRYIKTIKLSLSRN